MEYILNIPAMRNTARSAGSNCNMLSGLSLAHSLRLSRSIVMQSLVLRNDLNQKLPAISQTITIIINNHSITWMWIHFSNESLALSIALTVAQTPYYINRALLTPPQTFITSFAWWMPFQLTISNSLRPAVQFQSSGVTKKELKVSHDLLVIYVSFTAIVENLGRPGVSPEKVPSSKILNAQCRPAILSMNILYSWLDSWYWISTFNITSLICSTKKIT